MTNAAPPLYITLDDVYMAKCLWLAELAAVTVSPNPMVGSVVLDKRGRLVGQGYHQKAGGHHAEVFALDQAGAKAKGGTLYVNLEPCNHFGRTPPCTQKIIDAGIERVVIGTLDPNPLVAGTGRDALQNARISVRHGFLEAECKHLNEIFFHHITTGMPYVTVKLALTMDGKIANRHGDSQWLTGSFARQAVHHLRQHYDAILTTAETVLADNPQLSVRDLPNIRRQPARIVLDRKARLNPSKHRVFQSDTPVYWVMSERVGQRSDIQSVRELGITVLTVPESNGKLNLKAVLNGLYERGVKSIFVESGGGLATSLLIEKLTQKLYLFYAPKIVQDSMAKPAFAHTFQRALPQSPQLEILDTRQLDQDWLVEACPCF